MPARNVFPIPGGLSFEQAAAFPLTYQTAWRMIVGRGRGPARRHGPDPRHRRRSRLGGARDRAPLRRAGDRDDLRRGEGGRGARGRRLDSSSTTGPRTSATVVRRQTVEARRGRRRGLGRREDVDDVAEGGAARRPDRHVRRDERPEPEGGDPARSSGSRSRSWARRWRTTGSSGPSSPRSAAGRLRPRIDRVLPLSQARRGLPAASKRAASSARSCSFPTGAPSEWPDGD